MKHPRWLTIPLLILAFVVAGSTMAEARGKRSRGKAVSIRQKSSRMKGRKAVSTRQKSSRMKGRKAVSTRQKTSRVKGRKAVSTRHKTTRVQQRNHRSPRSGHNRHGVRQHRYRNHHDYIRLRYGNHYYRPVRPYYQPVNYYHTHTPYCDHYDYSPDWWLGFGFNFYNDY